MPQPALRLSDAAEELNVSPFTINRLVNSGDLPGFRVGGQIRIRRHDLDAYVAANATGPKR